MKKNLLLSFLSISILSFVIISCESENETCDTTDITYTNSIASILNTSCANAACHSAADAGTNGSLANYNDAVAFVGFNRMKGAINHDTGFLPMPYPQGSDKLDDCTIDKIEAWIDAGTPQ